VKDNTATSGNIGLDAGALWDVDHTFDSLIWNPKLGIVWRNINNPKFDWPASAGLDGVGGKFAVNPQMRTGLAFSPLHFWHFAADADLTRNLSPLDGYASQYVGAGTEVDVFNRPWINVPLRFGLKHNLAADHDGTVYTLGTGVNLLHLIVEVSGEVGDQKVGVQSDNSSGSSSTKTFPREAGAAVQLSFLFGGEEEHHHANSDSMQLDQPAPKPAPSSSSAAPQPAAQPGLTPDQVRAHADKAHEELNQQSAPPAIH
jgi:hypothetical protein